MEGKMKKISFILLNVILILLYSNQLLAQKNIFLGGSANINSGSNIFIGYQTTGKTAIVVDYYENDIFSVDVLYKDFILSNGFCLDNNQQKRFTTLLYTPKIYQINKKWKIFGKIGINLSGPINKSKLKQISSIFGFGLRWN